MWRIHYGDCLDVLKSLADNSVDAVVTDPPYGLEFMGKKWDTFAQNARSGARADGGPSFGSGMRYQEKGLSAQCAYQEWCYLWALECMRVLKPGGYLLACGGTRTYHRLTSGIEDAGFEIRDSLIWLHGQGFPKNLDVSKAIDKAAGAEREVIGTAVYGDGHIQNSAESIGYGGSDPDVDRRLISAPATAEAKQWQGWGTALKPAHEPVVMARKPFKGTVASNVLSHGTGAINIDGCRVSGSGPHGTRGRKKFEGFDDNHTVYGDGLNRKTPENPDGRWPANVVLSHSVDCVPTGETRKVKTGTHIGRNREGDKPSSVFNAYRAPVEDVGHADADGNETLPVWQCSDACPVAELDRQSGQTVSRRQPKTERRGGKATDFAMTRSGQTHEDSGGASRFFMQCAPDTSGGSVFGKTTYAQDDYSQEMTRSQRQVYPDQGGASRFFYCAKASKSERPVIEGVEGHPTVKPLALMRWLVRLVCPPGGLILDPFAGTGTTAEAALLEGFNAVLIESDPVSIQRIQKRMSKYERQAA